MRDPFLPAKRCSARGEHAWRILEVSEGFSTSLCMRAALVASALPGKSSESSAMDRDLSLTFWNSAQVIQRLQQEYLESLSQVGLPWC